VALHPHCAAEQGQEAHATRILSHKQCGRALEKVDGRT